LACRYWGYSGFSCELHYSGLKIENELKASKGFQHIGQHKIRQIVIHFVYSVGDDEMIYSVDFFLLMKGRVGNYFLPNF
jgi:hypothetical protein